jgi:hypothetical protein
MQSNSTLPFGVIYMLHFHQPYKQGLSDLRRPAAP